MAGIIRTRVGYCGGTSKDPTYDDIGDHVETIQIDFDPQQITYAQLLRIFADSHNPCRKPFSRQYTSAIYFHNEQQHAGAKSLIADEEKRRGEKVMTEVAPLAKFYLAEDYHQKYYLQTSSTFKKHYGALYPDISDFVHSTAAARVNGYLGWYGAKADLERTIDSLGLSGEAKQELLRRSGRLK